MPPNIEDTNAEYAPLCSCINKEETFCGQSPINIPSYLRDKTTAFNLCDRSKRDIHYSDELTDQDFELFKRPLLSANHRRRARALRAPKENATRYCTEKIADKKISKLCAEVGVDVQEMVDSCSLDIQVTKLKIIK